MTRFMISLLWHKMHFCIIITMRIYTLGFYIHAAGQNVFYNSNELSYNIVKGLKILRRYKQLLL